MHVLQIVVVFRNYVDCKNSSKTVVFFDCVDLFVNSSTL